MPGPYTIQQPVQGQPISSSLYGQAVKDAINDLHSRTEALEDTAGYLPQEFTGGGNPTTTGITFATGAAFLGAVFTCPPGGRCYISITAEVSASAASAANNMFAVVAPYIRVGGTLDAGADVLAASDTYGIKVTSPDAVATGRYYTGHMRFYLNGMTGGNQYNIRLRLRSNNAACTAGANLGRILIEPVLYIA